LLPRPAEAQAGAAFTIQGRVLSAGEALPGVSITAQNSLSGKKYLTSTDEAGNYQLTLPARGRYVVRAELSAFAAQTQEVVLTPESPSGKAEFVLQLASRVPQTTGDSTQAAAAVGVASSGRGAQQLTVTGDAAALESASAGGGGDTPLSGMPAMASSESAAAQSVSVAGQTGTSQDYGQRSMEDMRDRMQEMQASGQNMGMFAGNGIYFQGGGGGGPMGGPGGPGIFGGAIAMRRTNSTAPHGSLSYTAGNSALDAQAYDLNSEAAAKNGYSSNRFSASVGGALVIPHVVKDLKDFYFLSYAGNRSLTPSVQYSRVPTLLERTGDFSQTTVDGSAVTLYDPLTGQSLGNRIGSIDSTAQKLLAYIPQPNQSGDLNYRYATTADTESDSAALRLVHNFGAATTGSAARRTGGKRNSLNLSTNYSRSTSDQVKDFPTTGGLSKSEGWTVTAGWSVGSRKLSNNVNFNWNEMRSQAGNRNTGVTDVASLLGIGGVSTAASDWGVPAMQFTEYAGLSDVAASYSRGQTFSLSEQVMMMHAKHNLRFGADWRHLLTDKRGSSNAEGSFTFTGAATAAFDASGNRISGTGYDFADFLLGYADQTTLQYSPYTDHFRANAYDFFVQDDWRAAGKLTLSLGLRYEYQGPYTELNNRLVNLDVGGDFTEIAAVLPGETGPYHGYYPNSLVRPDRNNFAPRVGIAWKAANSTVVRAGYGINYNLGQYRQIVSELAAQPPFSYTETNTATASSRLTFADGFPTVSSSTLTNNYGIDPNYRLGYVQMWNLSVQQEVGRKLQITASYTGSKGTALDMVRAPNSLLSGAQAFLWETSQGFSILHAGSLRVRRRMAGGFSVGGTYTFAKSIDNASSIGGGSTTVAQNDNDLRAERGLSSFDQRHKLTSDFMYALPFGSNKRWLNSGGFWGRALGDWTLNGSVSLGTGTPYTARVTGDAASLARGVSGSLRADYNGEPIQLAHPTRSRWFNTSAFSEPASGTYGTAGRDTIIGPGSETCNLSLSKDFTFSSTSGLQIRADATNFFNHANYTSIDTVVNSKTFGQVTAVGTMRTVKLTARFRF
jgi:hypothetical protein